MCTVVAVMALILTGCATKTKPALTEDEVQRLTYAQLPTRPDEIVISGETITWDDVLATPLEEDAGGPPLKERLEAWAKQVPFDQFMAEAQPAVQQRLNRNIITRIVLSKRARRELGDKADDTLTKMAEKDLHTFIYESHGGNGAEADAALRRRGLNRQTYIERRKRDLLADYVVMKLRRDRPVTYGEIVARYNAVKDEEFFHEGVLQLRLIDIDVTKMKLEDVNEDPIQKARQLAEDLRKRIDAGEDFAALAKEYSNGPLGAQGGLLTPRAASAFAPPYDVLAEKAKEVKQGGVVGPVETAGHFFLVKVEDKQDEGYQPLGEVQDQVRDEIQLERRRAALTDLEKEIAGQAATIDTTRFVDYCLERLYRSATASSANDAGTK